MERPGRKGLLWIRPRRKQRPPSWRSDLDSASSGPSVALSPRRGRRTREEDPVRTICRWLREGGPYTRRRAECSSKKPRHPFRSTFQSFPPHVIEVPQTKSGGEKTVSRVELPQAVTLFRYWDGVTS